MPDTQKMMTALNAYRGDMESLNAFVSVAEAEFGDDWTLHIQSDLAGLPNNLKGKLDHACNYYGATIAWNEIQEYLNDDNLNPDDVVDRIPVLEYWLKFFGQSGKDVVMQLQEKISSLKERGAEKLSVAQEEPVQSAVVAEPVQQVEQPMEHHEPIENPVSSEESAPETVETQNLDSTPSETIQARIDEAFPSDEFFDEAAEPEAEHIEETPQIPESVESDRIEINETETTPISDALEGGTDDVETPALENEILDVPVVESPVVEDVVSAVSNEGGTEAVEPVGSIEMPVEPEIEQTVAAVVETPIEEAAIIQPEVEPMVTAPVSAQESLPVQDPALFPIAKIERQLDFLHQTQAWISARCVALGNIEPYTYTYYGFLMDLYQQTIEDIAAAQADAQMIALLQQHRPDMIPMLENTKKMLQVELDSSRNLFDTNPSPLIGQGVSSDMARKTLGSLDVSQGKEYLGPAPDGFEMLDDPYETESGDLNEDKLKSDYEKIEDESDVQLTQIAEPAKPAVPDNPVSSEKSLANSPQKGVERKRAVSLGVKPMRKKVTSESTDTE